MYIARGLDFRVTYLSGVHDFVSLLPQSVSYTGSFATRNGVEAPHLFILCRREGSPAKLCILCVMACRPFTPVPRHGKQLTPATGFGYLAPTCSHAPLPTRALGPAHDRGDATPRAKNTCTDPINAASVPRVDSCCIRDCNTRELL